MIDSVFSNCEDPENIEIVVRLDEDDPFLEGTNGSFEYGHLKFYNMKSKVLIGKSGVGIGVMLQDCYVDSIGTDFLLCGDDMVIETPNFDTMIKIMAPPDQIYLIYGDDGIQGKRLATHPFIGGEVLKALGGFRYLKEYKNDFIDTHLMDVFGRLSQKGCPRIAYNQNLKTTHLHHSAGKAPMDGTYANKMKMENSLAIYQSLVLTREYQADRLKKVVG